MREELAQAIFDSVFPKTKGRPMPELLKPSYLAMADAALLRLLEPTTPMLRGLIRHRGLDPDADEATLDHLGQIEVATMGVFVAAYKAMIRAALDPPSTSHRGPPTC